jgi:hypothetical protein
MLAARYPVFKLLPHPQPNLKAGWWGSRLSDSAGFSCDGYVCRRAGYGDWSTIKEFRNLGVDLGWGGWISTEYRICLARDI